MYHFVSRGLSSGDKKRERERKRKKILHVGINPYFISLIDLKMEDVKVRYF